MRRLVCCLGLVFLALFVNGRAIADDSKWLVPDALYRADVRLKNAPEIADAGTLIELPEFGRMRADLADAILLDGSGHMQTLSSVWRGEGQSALLLARDLKPGQDYHIYFGGGAKRAMQSATWIPKLSLFLETRRLPDNQKFESWPDMQKAWNAASQVDGAGFVNSIYQAGNLFGESSNFIAHYTGWLKAGGEEECTFYTLSSDASFVLVNGVYQFGWPGMHSPRADVKAAPSKKVACPPDYVKIDYYQVKIGEGESAAVLGWQHGMNFKAIPPESWIHPGVSQVGPVEEAHGRPVPIAKVQTASYIGYGNEWYFDAAFSLPGMKLDGWDVEWYFEDGAIVSGTECRRIISNSRAQNVAVKLQRGSDIVRGVKHFDFPDNLHAASIKNPSDIAHYLDLFAQENTAQLSKSTLDVDLFFLRDFATDGQMAGFAEAWLKYVPSPDDTLWLSAQLSHLRTLADKNPSRALAELRGIDPRARAKYSRPLLMLELDFLVFYLHDSLAPDVAKRIAFENPNSDLVRYAKIRAGDYYRLARQYQQAAAQYQEAQKLVGDESDGRKLPAQDKAYSVMIRQLLDANQRTEAASKLDEWELAHSMAKMGGDFLLLRARMLDAFGRWNEALSDLDSLEKMQPESPYMIEAEFYRAQALNGLGKKTEAHKIWNDIVKNYPRHELAAQSKTLASKP